MTTKQELQLWFDRGITEKYRYMIVVCDTFDWEDYPVYVTKDEDFYIAYDDHNEKNMQRIMEVYDLDKSWEEQSKGNERVFNFPPRKSLT